MAIFDQLLKMADVSLYEAKTRGRGTLNFYTENLVQQDIATAAKLEVELRRAVQRGELSVHYQPLIDMKTNRWQVARRWCAGHHPDLGPISPGVFIPMAEEIGIISKIGKFVLEQATPECTNGQTISRLRSMFRRCNFSSRMSAALLNRPCFPADLPANSA